jgi:hypothetical protein
MPSLSTDGEIVERKDVVLVLKQILEQCRVLDRADVSLNTNPSPEGYHLQIRIPLDEATKKCLNDVLAKTQSAPKEENKKP